MEGTVTISVEDYNQLKKCEEAVTSIDGFFVIYKNSCSGRMYVAKQAPENGVMDLIERNKFLEHRINEIIKEGRDVVKLKKDIDTKEDIIKRLEDTCNGWKELWSKQQNKSFFQKLFGS